MSTDEPESHSSDVECPTCGRSDFTSAQGVKVHHARVHGESIAGFDRTCPVCGDSFWSAKRNDPETCGPECGGELQSERMLGTDVLLDEDKLRRMYVEEGMTSADIAEEVGCGQPSAARAVRRAGIETRPPSGGYTGEDAPAWNGGKITKTCPQCGDEFETWPSDDYTKCSRECHTDYLVEILSGKDSPLWKGGEYSYGKGFGERKKRSIRERDGYKCQACGMSQEVHLEEHGCKLHVHHIIPARRFDDDGRRNDESNLVALCNPCHGRWRGIPIRPTIIE